jgi:hypothetical protein
MSQPQNQGNPQTNDNDNDDDDDGYPFDVWSHLYTDGCGVVLVTIFRDRSHHNRHDNVGHRIIESFPIHAVRRHTPSIFGLAGRLPFDSTCGGGDSTNDSLDDDRSHAANTTTTTTAGGVPG